MRDALTVPWSTEPVEGHNSSTEAEQTSEVRAGQTRFVTVALSFSVPSQLFDAIAAEEGALDDTALPPARREQVRRYFTELRKNRF